MQCRSSQWICTGNEVFGNLQLCLQPIGSAQRNARDRQVGITKLPCPYAPHKPIRTVNLEARSGGCFASSAERGICPAMAFETPCACATLRRAARAVTAAYDAALAPSGLRITQFSILRRLARLGPLPVTRLAAEAALDRSTMGRNLNPLERRGLVRFRVGNSDQRERIAYLTPAGEAAIAAALPHWRKAQKQIAALVQPSAIAELADQLDALALREQGRT
jgi:DNA-binding MarR family transcriptional regulator